MLVVDRILSNEQGGRVEGRGGWQEGWLESVSFKVVQAQVNCTGLGEEVDRDWIWSWAGGGAA